MTTNDAKRSARLLRSALRDTDVPQPLSACQRLVARLAGYRDWHHLEKDGDVETTRIDAVAIIAECMPGADATVVLSHLPVDNPFYGEVFASLPEGKNITLIGQGGTPLVARMAGNWTTPLVTEHEGIVKRIVISLDERYDDASVLFGGDDGEFEDLDYAVTGEIDADVMDLQWEIEVGGDVIAVGSGSLYQAREYTHPGMMAADVDLSSVGDGRIVRMIDREENFIGCLFVVATLEVAVEHRNRGLGTRLLSRMIADAEGHSIGIWPVKTILDMEAIGDAFAPAIDRRTHAEAMKSWVTKVIDGRAYVHDPIIYPVDGFPQAYRNLPINPRDQNF